MTAETEVIVPTARGEVEVDVVAVDSANVHKTQVLVECKNWKRKVTPAVANAFRSVVTDSGAHIGIILGRSGFQPGAVSAVTNTNVRLLTWEQFQELYVDRWYDATFRATLDRESDILAKYTEPIYPRVAREVEALSADAARRYRKVVERYWSLTLLAWVLAHRDDRVRLPVKSTPNGRLAQNNAVREATSYSSLLEAMCAELRAGTSELTDVFGGTLLSRERMESDRS